MPNFAPPVHPVGKWIVDTIQAALGATLRLKSCTKILQDNGTMEELLASLPGVRVLTPQNWESKGGTDQVTFPKRVYELTWVAEFNFQFDLRKVTDEQWTADLEQAITLLAGVFDNWTQPDWPWGKPNVSGLGYTTFALQAISARSGGALPNVDAGSREVQIAGGQVDYTVRFQVS